jgi:hypothetical protein
MDRAGLKEKLEVATNIVVIVGILVFGFVLYRSYTNYSKVAPQAPAVGTVLPALPAYSWDGHSQVLLLALRKGCHFCEDSMPFYRDLLKTEKSGGFKARLVAVLPDGEMDATRVLHDGQLDVPMVASFPLQGIQVSGTPTLILTDGNGRVEKAWVGEQDGAGEQAIRDALRK